MLSSFYPNPEPLCQMPAFLEDEEAYRQREEVKDFCAVPPRICIAVLPLTLIIKTIHLSSIPTFKAKSWAGRGSIMLTQPCPVNLREPNLRKERRERTYAGSLSTPKHSTRLCNMHQVQDLLCTAPHSAFQAQSSVILTRRSQIGAFPD
jgi:hypothetical protein